MRLDAIDPRVVEVVQERVDHAYEGTDSLFWSVLEITSCRGNEIALGSPHAYAGISFHRTEKVRPRFLMSTDDFANGAYDGLSTDFALDHGFPPDLDFDIRKLENFLGPHVFERQRDRVAYVADHELGHFMATFVLGSLYELGLAADIVDTTTRDRAFEVGRSTGAITDDEIDRITAMGQNASLEGVRLTRFVTDSFTYSPTAVSVTEVDEGRRERNADAVALWLSGRRPNDPAVLATDAFVHSRLSYEGRQHADEMRFVTHVTRVLDNATTSAQDRRYYSEMRERFVELSLSDDDLERAKTGIVKPRAMIGMIPGSTGESRIGRPRIASTLGGLRTPRIRKVDPPGSGIAD